MFGRFRKTNDAARETDGGAVAVDERDEPATSVAAPAADPAARERRLDGAARDPGRRPRHARARRERVSRPTARSSSDRFARTERAPVVDRDAMRDDEPHTIPAVVAEDTMVAMRARQRDRFGGIRWGSAFFGLLSAIGLAAILLGIAAAAGVALGVSEINDVRNGSADTIGLGGAILRARGPRALVVLRRLRRRAHGALRRRPPGHRRVGVDARASAPRWPSPRSSAAASTTSCSSSTCPTSPSATSR